MGHSMSAKMAKHSFGKFIFSIVFLHTLTILQGQTLLTASINNPNNSGSLFESCAGPYELVLRRGPDNVNLTEIFVSGTGSAQLGTDYEFPVGSIPATMGVEDTILIIPIIVNDDGLTEGLETFILEIAFLTGIESDFINVSGTIEDGPVVEIESPSDTIQWCRDVPFVLLANSNVEDIFWSPASLFSDSLGTSATVHPLNSGWVYATAGSDTCNAVDSVYFDLAIAEIGNADTVYICLDGSGVVLQGNIEGLATTFTWTPADSTLSNPLVLNPIANPTVTTTYLLQSDIGVCTATDRVVVRVDSIPDDLHIDIAPEKPYYCAGEIVAVFSPSIDTVLFPDITFNWTPNNGTFLTPLTLLNAALQLQDTTLYIRENINNACRSTDSILINVVPSGVPLSVTDTMLCPGEMFTVEVLSDQVTDPEWTPEMGLSCTKCLNPKVTVLGAPGSSLFYQFSGMILDCPVGASLSIQIPPVQTINISGENVVCSGEQIPLTITNPTGLSGFNWSVESGNASLSCTDCANPTVTINANQAVTVIVTANTTDPNFCGAFGVFAFTPGETNQFTGPTFFACIGDTVRVNTGDPTVFNLEWSVLSGSVNLSCTDCESPVVTVNSPFNQLRFLGETTNPNFCNVSGTLAVNAFPEDESNLLVEPDPIATPIGQGSSVTVTLNAIPEPSSVAWKVNGASLPSTNTSIQFGANEEINFVEAKFTNSKGCEQIDTISFVTVPPSYMIPNAFTPNNDDLNDVFRIIINGNIEVSEFMVFNRWGQMVYEAPEDDLTGWDGRFKNEPAASDTYVYKARILFPDGKEEVAKGDIMLLR